MTMNITRWDLTPLYSDFKSAEIDQDLATIERLAKDFNAKFKGQLATKLPEAMPAMEGLDEYISKVLVYLFLCKATASTDQDIAKRNAQASERVSEISGQYLVFFDLEVAGLSDAQMAALYQNPVVSRFKPYLENIRKNKPYMLSEEVEQALAKRSPFGPAEWDEFIDECEAETTFTFEGKDMALEEIIKIISDAPEAKRRFEAMKVLNTTLKETRYTNFRARGLNAVVGAKLLEDKERGYKHPMQARHLDNKVDDATVDALHQACLVEGSKQAKRFYKLKAAWLKHKGAIATETLAWSDRNAKMPFEGNDKRTSWVECKEIVLAAYGSFSPTLQKLVQKIFNEQWVDVEPYKGKVSGAFNYSFISPGKKIHSYNLLNYLGTRRDIATVAHEFGHSVHGQLAAEAQGALMWHAPMVYAETASIFGEMVTFNHLLEKAADPQEKLAMLMDKLNDFFNSAVRQISFSYFEQKVFAKRAEGRLTTDEFSTIWREVTEMFYGKEGEVFTYDEMDAMWSYVGHFMRPFYVYAYAFGELFTQSLYAKKDEFGDRFEPLYLDLLRAGGTKNAVELMAPFGLDPREPDFWRNGIQVSAAKWLDEAERISAELGVKV